MVGHSNARKGLLFHGLFVCLSSGSTTQCTSKGSRLASATSSSGSNTAVKVFPTYSNGISGTSPTATATLNQIVFEQDSGLSSIGGTDTGIATYMATKLPTAVQAIPVPDATDVQFTTDEDVAKVFDLNSYFTGVNTFVYGLDISTDAGSAVVQVGNEALSEFNGEFTFTPKRDFFGNVAFNFSYALQSPDVGYACSLTVSDESIIVKPVNDAPVLVETSDFSVFAGYDFSTSVLVATDVDFPENDNLLSNGLLTVTVLPTAGTLFADVACQTEVTPSAPNLAVENGEVAFCYRYDTEATAQEDSIIYIVKDGDAAQAIGVGTFTFKIQNPLVVSNLEPFEATEGETLSQTVATFGENEAVEGDFFVKVTSFPDPTTGILTVNGVELLSDSLVSSTSLIQFNPAENYFNVHDGAFVDALGDPLIADCPQGCPAEFKYKLVNEVRGIESENEGTVKVFVEAVDSGLPSVSSVELVTVPENDPNVELPENAIVISSDNGNQIFSVTLKIETTEGVEFTIGEPASESIATYEVSDVPANLEILVQTIRLFAPFNSSSSGLAELIFTVTSEDEAQTTVQSVTELDIITAAPTNAPVTSSPTDSPTRAPVTSSPSISPSVQEEIEETGGAGFFESTTNIAIVGGAGGLVLILIIVSIVFFTKSGPKQVEEDPKDGSDFEIGMKEVTGADGERKYEARPPPTPKHATKAEESEGQLDLVVKEEV